MRSESSFKDILCEVHQTADGYAIYCPNEDRPGFGGYYGWWGKEGYSWNCPGWGYRYCRKIYKFKWYAILKAKVLEEEMNAKRREIERRRKFVEKKVWR